MVFRMVLVTFWWGINYTCLGDLPLNWSPRLFGVGEKNIWGIDYVIVGALHAFGRLPLNWSHVYSPVGEKSIWGMNDILVGH